MGVVYQFIVEGCLIHCFCFYHIISCLVLLSILLLSPGIYSLRGRSDIIGMMSLLEIISWVCICNMYE